MRVPAQVRPVDLFLVAREEVQNARIAVERERSPIDFGLVAEEQVDYCIMRVAGQTDPVPVVLREVAVQDEVDCGVT